MSEFYKVLMDMGIDNPPVFACVVCGGPIGHASKPECVRNGKITYGPIGTLIEKPAPTGGSNR